VFFTGLSGSGKSTIANVLLVKFLEMGGRPVKFLAAKRLRLGQRAGHVVHHHVEDRVIVRLVTERRNVSADIAARPQHGRRALHLELPLEHLRVIVGRLLTIAAADLEVADVIGHHCISSSMLPTMPATTL